MKHVCDVFVFKVQTDEDEDEKWSNINSVIFTKESGFYKVSNTPGNWVCELDFNSFLQLYILSTCGAINTLNQLSVCVCGTNFFSFIFTLTVLFNIDPADGDI